MRDLGSKASGRSYDGAPAASHSGLVVGFFTCYGTTSIPSSLSWRLPFIILAVYTLTLIGMLSTVLLKPPQWLSLHEGDAEVTTVGEIPRNYPVDREKIIGARHDGDSAGDKFRGSGSQKEANSDEQKALARTLESRSQRSSRPP